MTDNQEKMKKLEEVRSSSIKIKAEVTQETK